MGNENKTERKPNSSSFYDRLNLGGLDKIIPQTIDSAIDMFSSKQKQDKVCIDGNIDIPDCISFKRIDYILCRYNLWIQNLNKHSMTNQQNQSISTILKQAEYDALAILNDYHHLINNHSFDIVYKHLTNKCNDINKCKPLRRNHRDRREHNLKDLYLSGSTEEIKVQQLIDMLHSYYLHSYDLGFKIDRNEYNAILQESKKTKEEYEFDDEIDGKSVNIHTKQKLLSRNRERVRGVITGFDRIVRNTKFISDFGYNDDDNKNIDGDDIKRQQPKRQSLYDFGIKYNYYDHKNEYFVTPKYKTLKQELIELISFEDWKVLYVKSKDYYNSDYAKSLTAFKHFNQTENYGEIYEGSQIAITHIIAMMVYCNYDNTQYQFSKTYRKSDINESTESLIEQHSVYGNLGRLLFECVHIFGFRTGPKDTFYHGINQCMLFLSTVACIKSPLSTSSSFNVALNFATRSIGDILSENQGIILKLTGKSWDTMKYFDCSWLSSFPQEKELFFIGNDCPFYFASIIDVELSKDYSHYIQCCNIIRCLVNFTSFFDFRHQMNDWKNVSTKVCKDVALLIIHQIKKTTQYELNMDDFTKYKKFELRLPKYIKSLFTFYAINVDKIVVNLDILYNSPFKTFLCCEENYKFIKLEIFLNVFINCQEIVIAVGEFAPFDEGIWIGFPTLKYIFQYLSKHKTFISLKKIEIIKVKDAVTTWQACQRFHESFNKIGYKLYQTDSFKQRVVIEKI